MKDPKIELIKDKDTWFVRKGICKPNCVVAGLTFKDLRALKNKIETILGRVDGCAIKNLNN